MLAFLLVFMIIFSCHHQFYTYADTRDVKRNVKVAFFPMEGYHIKNPDGTYGGVEVEYFKILTTYVDWEIEYVDCVSWEDALLKLENKEVDLVGTSQYNEERAKKFLYARLPCINTFGAIATNSDLRIAFEDFSKMDNLHYGIVKDYVKTKEMYEYFEKNGITNPRVKEFSSTRELHRALDNHEIDAMVHTFMEVKDGQRLIGRFASSPTYFMTYRGNDELMDELNEGIADIKYQQPSLEWELIQKFYANKWDNTILYTTAELEFMKTTDEIVVGYKDGFFPFNYEENGELKGLIRDRLDASGLPIHYQRVNSTKEGLQAVENHEIDVMVHMAGSYDDGNAEGLQQLNDYATVPFVLVTHKDYSVDSVETIVTMSNFKEEIQELLITDNKKIEYKDSMSACFDAVACGEADALMGGAYISEYKIKTIPKYRDLSISAVLNGEIYVHPIVNQDADEALKSIITKALGHISEKEVTEYKLEHNDNIDFSLKMFIQKNSDVIISLILVFSVMVLLVAVHIVRDSKRIQTLLYKDTNMDVWNLHHYIKELELRRRFNSREKFAIVYTNIIRMRRYTIVYGRNSATDVYNALTKCLKESITSHDETYAKMYEDHFIILLKYDDYDQLLDRLNDLRQNMETAMQKASDNHLQLEFGVVTDIQNDQDSHSLIESAIQVLEENQAKSTNLIYVYDREFEHQIKETHKKESMLSDISVEDHFEVYYQPKVDIRQENIVGAEALIRFRDPTDGNKIKSPWYFVPYFEQIGRIVELDFFVLHSVCKMLRARLDQGLTIVPISCNFSRLHFVNEGFTQKFEAILNQYQINKNLIEVEITETVVVEDNRLQIMTDNLKEMKENGIRLAIDDFGSGYSSLGTFEQVPASVIKMDRSFMVNRENGERQLKIMRGIVKLSEELNTDIVCEGVETEDDVELMRKISAYIAQGYYYSKPVAREIFENKLNQI